MKNKIILFLLILISSQSNGQTPPQHWTMDTQRSTPTGIKPVKGDGLLDGDKNGEWIYDNGNGLILIELYDQGILKQRSYENTESNNRWIIYYDGKKKLTQYHNYQGELYEEHKFIDGKKHGKWAYFNKGKVIDYTIFEQDSVISRGSWDYSPIGHIYYLKDPEGFIIKSTNYYLNGQIKSILIWNKNKIWEIEASYDIDGNPVDGGNLKSGNGTLKERDSEGNIFYIGKYKNGKLVY